MPLRPICSWLFVRSQDKPIQIVSNVDGDEKMLKPKTSEASDLGKKNLIFAWNPGDQSFPLARLSVIFSHLSGVYFAPSIHKPPYKADFSDCLIAQHRRSLCLAWGQLREWDGIVKIVEKCHPGMKYWWTKRPCLFRLPSSVEWESRSLWAAKREANTNTLIWEKGDRRRAGTPRSHPSFPSEVSLSSPSPQQTIIRFSCTSLDVVYSQPKPSRLNIWSPSGK